MFFYIFFSGKTTLLNTIGGRSPLGVTGTVTVDG
jgi:hypothetical protein